MYLVYAKRQIIIPQEWIFQLDQEILNNRGKNSNQNYRIYWSSVGILNGIPDSNILPKFDLPESKVFPQSEEMNEACYIARIKRFCCKYKL